MADERDERPRPTPRPRPGAAARPSPRPRVAGSRRDREEPATAAERTARAVPAPRPGRPAGAAAKPGAATAAGTARPGATAAARRTARAAAVAEQPARRRRGRGLALTLALLCLLAGGGAGYLYWQRSDPPYVDPDVFAATREAVEALYAFDYRDPEGSVAAKLDVLTGDLRDQYEQDLTQGGIVESAEQVSATTRLEVSDVALQQVDDAQDAATLVVFGDYVTESVTTGGEPAPEGSGCRLTPEGASSCTQTIQVHVVELDGGWKIDQITVLTGV
ncbi:hypothetical protein [Geodermatophilus sp. SYSU D00815]